MQWRSPKDDPLPQMPAGSLFVDDWSFEDAGAPSARRGPARGQRRHLQPVAEHLPHPEAMRWSRTSKATRLRSANGKPVADQRSAQGLHVGGQWSVSDGCLASGRWNTLPRRRPKMKTPMPPNHSLDFGGGSVIGNRVARSRSFEAVDAYPSFLGDDGATHSSPLAAMAAVRLDDLALKSGASAGGAKHTRIGELARSSTADDSFAIEYRRASLVELMEPWSRPQEITVDEETQRLDLPPGAFACTPQRDQNSIQYTTNTKWGPEALVAYLYPEVVAAGVTLILAENSERHFQTFDVEGVQRLVLGAAAERMEWILDSPTRVSAASHGAGMHLRFHRDDALKIQFRTDFEAARSEASQLLVEAQTDLRGEGWGAAWNKLEDVRRRLPYFDNILSRVDGLQLQLRKSIETELTAIETEGDAAQFLDSLERYQAVLTRADRLLAKLKGSSLVDQVSRDVEDIRSRVETLSKARREVEAERLRRLAEVYQNIDYADRTQTAQELLRALKESYRDTEAARQSGGN